MEDSAMSTNGDSGAAQDKAQEIAAQLADKTGVAPEDVKKVLSSLGLDTALLNRLAKEEYADKYGLAKFGLLRLSELKLENLRIAAGERQI
jgi:hypothetical protein